VYVPGVLDLEAAGAAELVGLAGLRHGAERRAAEVEVHGLLQARAVGAFVREDDDHRGAGARRVPGASHLRKIIAPTAAVSSLTEYNN
jgi:NaMN:DMB phosphoribosyltransferase